MKNLSMIAIVIALSACGTAERDAETNQSGITFSGTASMGIARDGN